jgi:hypothetical protein
MKRAEQAALKAYPNVEQPVWDESYPKTLFVRHTERNAFTKGYEQAEKDTIERACEWLFSHLPILVDYYNEDIHTNADRSEFIKLFRTQMDDEKESNQ